MNRFHVHVNVSSLEQSLAFYSRLFGAEPSVVKPDYAKWMLDDPRVNFAISQRERGAGVDHLGIQTEDSAALEQIGARLKAADAVRLAEVGTTCCYAHSDKYWTEDPQGLRWETFHTHGDATTYYAPDAVVTDPSVTAAATSCCAPSAKPAAACCAPAAKDTASSCCS
jgi:hypothetical protein